MIEVPSDGKPHLYSLENTNWLNGDPRIQEYKGVVIHWTGSPMQDPCLTMRYLIYVAKLSYNYLIGPKGEIYEMRKPPLAGYHAGSKYGYYPLVKAKFGEQYTTNLSPNQCTIGICLYALDANGTPPAQTLASAKALTASVIKQYAPHLNPLQDIFIHSQFADKREDDGSVSQSQCHKYFFDKSDPERINARFRAFRNDVKSLVSGPSTIIKESKTIFIR